MKQKLKSLQIHMLLPVIVMTLFVVTMLTTLFSHAYISMMWTILSAMPNSSTT